MRGINETLNKLEDKIDEKNGIEKEEVKLEKKKRFHDKFIKDLKTIHLIQDNLMKTFKEYIGRMTEVMHWWS